VATHWSGIDHQEMFKKWNAGDTAGARAVNARLVESFAFETGDDNPNPLPTKAMMNHLGLDVGDARLPMGPPPAGLAERAAQVMKNLVTARG
jgi:4-hydroxy-tetrahydrodipicolinate synthase